MRGSTTTVARGVSATPDIIVEWLRALVSLAFVVLLPLLLISTSLRGLVTDRDLLLVGFRQNQVDVTTGLDQPQLERIADAFVAYFQGPPGRLQMQVQVRGQTRPLFNDREVQHMEDVQALIQLFLRLQLVALVGVLSLVDFTELWTRFHQVAFRNDLWQLDPSRDYLIMLFPEPFWYTATMRMAITVGLETLGIAVLGGVLAFVAPRLGR